VRNPREDPLEDPHEDPYEDTHEDPHANPHEQILMHMRIPRHCANTVIKTDTTLPNLYLFFALEV
jgi:hypothetical protein